MKCPNCGAEVTGSYCSYCGSELPKEPVNIVNNYYGNVTITQSSNNDNGKKYDSAGTTCPNCGGTRISFRRESSGMRGFYLTFGECKNCGHAWVMSQNIRISPKDKIVALVLCIFFGYFGAHYFYVGKYSMGIVYIFTVGLFGIGWIVDIVRLVNGTFTDVDGNPLR